MPPKANTDIKTVVKEAIKQLLSENDFIIKLLKKVTDSFEILQKTV